MIRRISILLWMSILSILGYAQEAGSTFTQLSIQCQQVVELEKAIDEKHALLDTINSRIEALVASWEALCDSVINSPSRTQEDIQNLLSHTDKDKEGELYNRLLSALNTAPPVNSGNRNEGGSHGKHADSDVEGGASDEPYVAPEPGKGRNTEPDVKDNSAGDSAERKNPEKDAGKDKQKNPPLSSDNKAVSPSKKPDDSESIKPNPAGSDKATNPDNISKIVKEKLEKSKNE